MSYASLPNQVNCLKVAGAGLALQIREAVPGWFEHYQSVKPALGSISVFDAGDAKIVNLYAQDGIGTYGALSTDYGAMASGLQVFADSLPAKSVVYIPYGMGCGLGGGDWNVVAPIVYQALKAHDVRMVRLANARAEVMKKSGPAGITSFRGEHAFLSNFAPAEILMTHNEFDPAGTIKYPTAEHAYQACKSLRLQDRLAIAGMSEPKAARAWGKYKCTPRPDWKEERGFINSDMRFME